ncbi:hypothetical protein O7627_21275 [Solwaraspora sp. WMMD1047]|uniref:hypothetical protein n=1 Tax=Solwaraspora sp. WMMD1047 TaxID=3016102 RepID=UPI0024164923|nr:hypothetical protein [Solwaraspora sp. WMMD1047]MDG4831815.1 hypothetical protein [Solwaraspora sp. WMMD1047]
MDGVSMETDGTTGAMDLMDEAGRMLNTGWGEVSERLTMMAGRLGQGELGAAYLERYQPAATETTAAVEAHCRQPGRLAAVGHQCVDLYRTADQRIAGTFTSVDPAAPTAAPPADATLA